jgi:hypothetical protein
MTDTTKMSSVEELEHLLETIDEEMLDKMSDTEVLEMRKKLNPYSTSIQTPDKVLCFSYTDLGGTYLRKILTTSMIGFLNRMCDEWQVPTGVPVIPVYDYVKDPELLNEFENGLKDPTSQLLDDIKENKKMMAKRVIVKEFLEEYLQYNPDIHVRSGYRPNPKDLDRNILETPAAKLAIHELAEKDSLFKEQMHQYEIDKLIQEKAMDDDEVSISEKVKPSEKIITDVTKQITEMIPSRDLFHRFNHYYETNYEELQTIVEDLYCEKPCFETAINPYGMFDTDEDADKFIQKHRDEVISTIFKSHCGKWNIISPFKKVRESVKFFNKNTEVLEQIADQIEKDAKLGAELMKKRIKVQKKKNIAIEGADDPEFVKWKATNKTLKDMGAETLNEKDLEDECPDNVLEVPVFRIGKGGQNMKVTKFYTEVVKDDAEEVQRVNKGLNENRLTDK